MIPMLNLGYAKTLSIAPLSTARSFGVLLRRSFGNSTASAEEADLYSHDRGLNFYDSTVEKASCRTPYARVLLATYAFL